MERRRFLKSAAATAVIMGARTRTLRAQTSESKSKVAILGGGLAGLTAAYRLVQRQIPCVLFEAQNRLGGRVWTQNEFGKGVQTVELGAEWVRANESATLKLCDELQVATQLIPAPETGIESEIFWFEGNLRSSKDVLSALKPLSESIKKDQRKIGDKPPEHPDFIALDKLSLADYLKSKNGECERWILNLLDVAFVCKFGSETKNQSAMNFLLSAKPSGSLENWIRGTSEQIYRIKGGSSRLPDSMAAFLQKDLEIQTAHRLAKISRTPAERFELTLSTGDATKVQTFERVVCTLPFSVLRNISGVENLGLSAQKLKAIKELGYGTHRKFTFETKGRVWKEKRANAKQFSGNLLGDFPSQSFYDSSRGIESKYGLITNYRGGYQGINFSGIESDKAQVFSDFEKACPGIKENLTGETASFSWANFGYSLGSMACLKPGQHHGILASIAEPELKRSLFFAGEHLSQNFHGTMAGAIETGDAAARDLLADL